MPNFNCMYGAPHNGQYVACRSKAGRTVGWVCATHFKQHEHSLLKNGYHFRTIEELEARGEVNGGKTSAEGRREGVAETSSSQQQQPSDDDPRGDSDRAKLAHERPSGDNPGRGSHGGTSTQPPEGGGSDGRNARPAETKEIVEARPAGGETEVGRFSGGVPATQTQGALDWPAWTQGAGHLTLTPEQREVLQSPFDDNDITIRYDGVVYVPWRKYWGRMVKAFAPLVPSVIPVDSPRFQGQEIIVGVVMVCGGVFIGKAWGSHRLEGQNDRMAVGDRIESAISDAISKIGKRLDMGEQLWDDQFRDWWKSQYAESYQNRGRTYWRRRAVVEGDALDDDPSPFDN